MKKQEMSAALELARSGESLKDEDIGMFDGYGFREFRPVYATLRSVARLIRWQCIRWDGSIDGEELNNLAFVARRKFNIV